MRTLDRPPPRVTLPDGSPAVGSYAGPLPPVDLAPLGGGRLFRLLHEKRWIYVALATEELLATIAIVRLGYAANAFAFAFDPSRRGLRGELLFDRSALLPGPLASVDNEREPRGRFRSPRLSISFEPSGEDFRLVLEAPGLGTGIGRVDATLRGAGVPQAISAVAEVTGGSIAPEPRGRLVNHTEKRVLFDVEGEASFSGVRYPLRGGLAGFDFTAGYLGRETKWKWAFGLGRATTGERVAWNLVQGFVGAPECALWIDDRLVPLPEASIEPSRDGPLEPWKVRAGDALDLVFEPGGVHAEHRNLGIAKSLFIQPCGRYAGVLRAGGKELVLDKVFGVVEHQEVLW